MQTGPMTLNLALNGSTFISLRGDQAELIQDHETRYKGPIDGLPTDVLQWLIDNQHVIISTTNPLGQKPGGFFSVIF